MEWLGVRYPKDLLIAEAKKVSHCKQLLFVQRNWNFMSGFLDSRYLDLYIFHHLYSLCFAISGYYKHNWQTVYKAIKYGKWANKHHWICDHDHTWGERGGGGCSAIMIKPYWLVFQCAKAVWLALGRCTPDFVFTPNSIWDKMCRKNSDQIHV